MALPAFAKIVSTTGVRTGGPRFLRLSNSNTFLRKYEGADGVKIGHTLSAGPTLVASATRDGHRLYAVVLNSEHRDADAMALLDWAFAAFSWPASQGHRHNDQAGGAEPCPLDRRSLRCSHVPHTDGCGAEAWRPSVGRLEPSQQIHLPEEACARPS
jgi:D-alanyl-D-alanine carboxypeptidase